MNWLRTIKLPNNQKRKRKSKLKRCFFIEEVWRVDESLFCWEGVTMHTVGPCKNLFRTVTCPVRLGPNISTLPLLMKVPLSKKTLLWKLILPLLRTVAIKRERVRFYQKANKVIQYHKDWVSSLYLFSKNKRQDNTHPVVEPALWEVWIVFDWYRVLFEVH
jgi:hypothetical protein